MRISYDSEVDAMYITLIEGQQECRMVRLSDEIALDFGTDEELAGIEILDAKRLVGKGKLPRLLVDNVSLGFKRSSRRRASRETTTASSISRRVARRGNPGVIEKGCN